METTTRLARPTSPGLEPLVGRAVAVLDDGFIRLVDYMGNDASVVDAARVSYGVGAKGPSDDRTLIRYLMRHWHTSPFEMCEIKFHLRVPMDTWRQWIRHRTASVNEYSTRYSAAIDAAHRTAPSDWRRQAVANRQGSEGTLAQDVGNSLSKEEKELQEAARQVYERRLAAGVAREQARKDLPLSTYTEAFWKIDLHNLLHFLELRMDERAQLEIRTYAKLIGTTFVATWCPLVWEAFQDYRLMGLRLSAPEIAVLNAMTSGDITKALKIAGHSGWLERREGKLARNRERAEAEVKLMQLGIHPPWSDQP